MKSFPSAAQKSSTPHSHDLLRVLDSSCLTSSLLKACIAIAFQFTVGCAQGHTKQDCNSLAKRNTALYSQMAEIAIRSDRLAGHVDPISEMDTRALFATYSVFDWHLCIESAETDHVDPGIPFAPVWEQAEFKL